MDKRIIYITQKLVYGMLLDEWGKVQRCCNDLEDVFLWGIIEHHSQRKMLGIIPLPDKYVYKVYPLRYLCAIATTTGYTKQS